MTIRSLADGRDLTSLGRIAGLVELVGTESAGAVLLGRRPVRPRACAGR